MTAQNCLIIGASHAGVALALALRQQGWQGGIRLIDAEQELPYHRPPLSKEYLAGRKTLDAMRLRPLQVYQDQAIDWLPGRQVLSIDRQAGTVSLDTGETLAYDKLALCTGAAVRKLPLGPGLERVHYLRTAADAGLIRQHLPDTRRVVIIGAGYIGLEAAAVLRQAGLQVTVLETADRVLSRVTAAMLSDCITALHRRHGVSIHTARQVTGIRQAGERQLLVECASGECLPADLVLAGVGVVPNVQLAQAAGLAVDDGIVVDCHAVSSDPVIFAAGDCTRYPHPLYGSKLRLESVQNANDQARVAAANICGKAMVYQAVPWFWSDQYDLKLQLAGLSAGHDQCIVRGDPQDLEAGFAVFYCKEGALIAADCVRRPREFIVGKRLIAANKPVDQTLLQDESSDPAGWL